MVLEIVKFGHPALRRPGAVVQSLTPEIGQLIADMLETMHEARGVGLAAQQVGRVLQVTVLDVREATERPSTLELDGKPADVASFMPLVLINPEVTSLGKPVLGPEGCLSFPEIFADISRPESIEVKALDQNWKRLHFRCGGLLARAIQHELDHLRGILFIDRMDSERKRELGPELDELQAETKAALQTRAKRRETARR